MKKLKDIFLHLEHDYDKMSQALRKRKGRKKGVLITAYHGYSNHKNIFIEGRVLLDRGISESDANDSVIKNIERMYKHFNSKELIGITVECQFGGNTYNAVTDEEGYYEFQLPTTNDELDSELWQEVELSLQDGQKISAHQIGHYQSPTRKTECIVISDIDDTILQSGAHSLLKMIKTTFGNNADTRLTFSGVDHLYNGLLRGNQEEMSNPIFYLSNSPWNLFDFLDDFMELKGIPKGTVFLRDWGMDENKTFVDDMHKLNTIKKLINNYPELPFILIGDSGEKDPEYYTAITKEFPDRIEAIYIRNVTEEPRNSEVLKMAEEMDALGVPMLLINDSLAAGEHAHSLGLIKKEVIDLLKKSMSS